VTDKPAEPSSQRRRTAPRPNVDDSTVPGTPDRLKPEAEVSQSAPDTRRPGRSADQRSIKNFIDGQNLQHGHNRQ